MWNEPDSKPYALKDDRDIFAIRTVHELRIRYSPNSAVVTSTHTSGGLNYLERILQKGAGPYLNGIALHAYRSLAPEIPEPDGYTGNPTGLTTLPLTLEHARQLLTRHNVNPPDIYLTEMNYALNLQPQYDENDQANFMVRMNISSTKEYVRCFVHHALHNGRLVPATYPNLVRHMVDTKFDRRLMRAMTKFMRTCSKRATAERSPIWSTGADRLVRVSDQPTRATDIYGNPVRFAYDAAAKAAFTSRRPPSTRRAAGSRPELSVSHRLQIILPEHVDPGKTAEVGVRVKSLAGGLTKLVLQFPVDWNLSSQSQEIADSKTCAFPISVPPTVAPGVYPVVTSLLESDDRLLSIVGAELRVGPSPTTPAQTGEIVSDNFERGNLADWQVHQSTQSQINVVPDGETKVLRMIQKGVDYPALIQRPTAAVQQGSLEFR